MLIAIEFVSESRIPRLIWAHFIAGVLHDVLARSDPLSPAEKIAQVRLLGRAATGQTSTSGEVGNLVMRCVARLESSAERN